MEFNIKSLKTMTRRYPVKIDDDIQSIMAQSGAKHGCSMFRTCIMNAAINIGLPVIAKSFGTQSKGGSKNE